MLTIPAMEKLPPSILSTAIQRHSLTSKQGVLLMAQQLQPLGIGWTRG